MKPCTKCGIEKSSSSFCKDRTRKDGLATQCKDCRRKYSTSEKGRAAQRKGSQRKRERFPEKERAHHAVNHAIAAGKIIRPTVCPSCDTETFIESHHEDYNKPFDIDWVCKECHTKLHTKEKLCV